MANRSLRWTMLGWTAVLLVGVVGAFALVLRGSVSRAVYVGVDQTLDSRARAIALQWEEEEAEGGTLGLELADALLRGLTEGGWYEIRDANGAVLGRGGSPPEESADVRERVVEGPRGTHVRVGRSIAAERAALATLLGVVSVSGAALIAIALAGGWWLASRTLRPIAEVARTASQISERDLTQRLDPDAVPSELRELALTLNAAFERLEQAFQRQARFTADASHELRTPLAVIRAQAEQVLRRPRTVDEYRTALEACLRSARRMAGVVDGLLTLAHADAGERPVARVEVALDAVAREAAEEARLQLNGSGAELHLDLAPARVHGDPALLGEVVGNLVTNALRYGVGARNGSGRVDVRVRTEDGAAVLAVADDGPGIPAEALPHVFERFYRVDPARSREHGGAGLGLAITRWIVEAHGGTITAESRPGRGSTFTVELPALG